MARYGLARHVFVCRDEEYIVVLDLKRDRYFALEAAKTAALTAVLPGWPAPAPEFPPADAAVHQVAVPLLRQGWLLEDSANNSKEATPVAASPPEAELTAGTTADKVDLGFRTVIAFVLSSVFAKFELRFRPIEKVIRRVAARKAKHAGTGQALDIERTRRLLAAFERLRVFLFSSRDECLHDSLALLEFLARHGQFPGWVFGVRARPFAAHCWVQHAEVVLNDTVEHAGAYIPIMVV